MELKRRAHKLKIILILFMALVTYSILYLQTLKAKDPTWIFIGKIINIFSPNMYRVFKQKQKESRLEWFNSLATEKSNTLHALSGWGYMSEDEYNNVVDQALKELSIKEGDSVFELGCGVGADLKRIRDVYGKTISIGGSDISHQAIEKIRKFFRNEADQFRVLSMTEKNDKVMDDSIDHVISIGAFAMYLYIEEMELALKEAIRITKPRGKMCFTHFVEPNGTSKGSILEPVEKSFWPKIGKKYDMENVVVKQMVYYRDRYFVCFTKR